MTLHPMSTRLRLGTLSFSKRFLWASLLACIAASAHAHSDQVVSGGFIAGYLHPLAGLDHVLAMLAVGILGAALGRPFRWAMPALFLACMVAGALAGMAGYSFSLLETSVAVSVIALGLAIVFQWRKAVVLSVGIVAISGVLHGFAHGAELPLGAAATSYIAGFLVAACLLHLAGIAVASLKAVPKGDYLVRAAGGLIAATGAWIVFNG